MEISDAFCFDYSIAKHGGQTQLGESVAESIERCLEFLSAILSADEIVYLKRQAAIALKRPNNHRSGRGDFHPISNALANEFPIYAGLAHYPVVTDPKVDNVHPGAFLGDIARIALILRHLDRNISSVPNNKDLAAFARKISKAPHDAKELLYNPCSDFLDPEFDLDLTIHELTLAPSKSIAHTTQRGKVSTLHEPLIRALNILRPFIEERSSKLRSSTITDRKISQLKSKLVAQRGTQSKNAPEPDFEPTQPTISLDNDNGPNQDYVILDSKTENESTLSLAQHHHWIRFNNIIAGSGKEIALQNEAKSAFLYLLGIKPSDKFEHAAQWIWILTFLNGRPFDAIAGYFLKISNSLQPNGQIASIALDQNTVTILVHHPIESKLDALGDASATHELIRIRTSVPDHIDSGLALIHMRNIAEDGKEALTKFIKAKKTIASQIAKSSYKEFTESRLRGCLIHAVLTQKYDLPIVQLIFDEPLNLSYASLNYIAISNSEIQDIVNIARRKVFENAIDHPSSTEIEENLPKVGSLVAQKFDKALQATANWFNQEQKLLRRKGRQDWLTRHNKLATTTQHILFISTAHRGYSDFRDLKLHDLGLASGLAIYRDKPSDPSLLRRLAVISKYPLTYIFHWIEHLEAIIQQKRIPLHAKRAAEQALNSTGPLFFTVNPHVENRIQPIDPVIAITARIPEAKPNIARHLISTQLRHYNIKAIMLEAHLGHNLALSINNPNGLLSPLDLHTEISDTLDLWLSDTGYAKPPACKIPTNHQPSTLPSILASIEAEKDTAKIRGFLKAELKSAKGTESVRTLVDKLIVSNFGENSSCSDEPPHPDKIITLRKELIEALPPKPILWVYACRVLRTKLRSQYRNRGWKIPSTVTLGILLSPPQRITCGHLSAYDSLSRIRGEFLSHVRSNLNKDDAYNNALFALVIFGPCQTFQQAKIWLKKIKNTGHKITQGSIIFDLDEAHGSRSISGISAIFVSKWIHHNKEKIDRIRKTTLNPYSLSFIEECVALASHIEFPPIFSDILNGDLVCRELPASRAIAYLNNSCHPNPSSMSTLEYTPQNARKRKKGVSKEIQTLQHYIELRQIIKDTPRNNSANNESAHENSINVWLTKTDRPLLVAIIAEWAILLLNIGANLKTAGELLTQTTLDYISDVYNTLADIPIELLTSEDDEGSEEISELIDIKLSAKNYVDGKAGPTNKVRASSVARFFKDMGLTYNLTKIKIFSATDSLLGIDANIITSSEIDLATHQLDVWSESKKIRPSNQLAIKEASKAVALNQNLGLRRSELRGLAPPEFSKKGILAAKIRTNTITSLKTPSAWRNIEFPSYMITSKPESSKHLFPRLAEDGGSNYAFMAVKNSLQLATGNPASRLHHNRHSVGTTQLERLTYIKLPSDRLISGCLIASNLGHATLRSTVNYYGHLNHHIIANYSNSDIAKLDHKLIANLQNESETTIRQRWHRHRQNPTLFIARCINTEGYLKKENCTKKLAKTIVANPPVERNVYSDVGPLKNLTLWIIERARGIPLNVSTKTQRYSTEMTSTLLERLILAQTQLGAAIVDHKYLNRQILDLNSQSPVEKKNRSARIPKALIDPLVTKIKMDNSQLSSSIIHGLSHISWNGHKKIIITLTHDEASTLTHFFNMINCSLTLTESRTKNNYSIASPNIDSPPIENSYIRIIVLSIIIFFQFQQTKQL